MIIANLKFNGNTEEAFNFYKSVFAGEITNLQRFGDTPHGEQMPDQDKKKIMHIALKGPGGVNLIGNDHLDMMGGPFVAGNNFSLSIHPDSEMLAGKLFNSLAAGGTVAVPIGKVFWGAYFGMLVDKFGITWLVNHEYK